MNNANMTDITLNNLALDTNELALEVATEPPPPPAIDPVTWLEEHGDALYAYALLRVREPSTAEDLVQETLVAALNAIGSFKGQSSVRTWLTGIMKHKVIDHLRKSMREQPLDDQIENDQQNFDAWFDETGKWAHRPGDWESPEQSLENTQFWDTMNNCIEKLPTRLRTLYILREFDGLDTDEILSTLNISSPNNLWTMLSRTRLQLRSCLEQNWFGA